MVESTTPGQTPATGAKRKKSQHQTAATILRQQQQYTARRKERANRSLYLKGLDWILNNLNKIQALDQIALPVRTGDPDEDNRAERAYAEVLLKREAILDGLRQQQTGEIFNLYVETKRSLAAQEKFYTFYLKENSAAAAIEAQKKPELSTEWGDDHRRAFQWIENLHAENPHLAAAAKEYHDRFTNGRKSSGLTVPRVPAVSPVAAAASVAVVPVEVYGGEVSH